VSCHTVSFVLHHLVSVKKKEKEAMAETIAAPEALALGESLPVGDPHVRAPSRPFRLPIFDSNEKPGR